MEILKYICRTLKYKEYTQLYRVAGFPRLAIKYDSRDDAHITQLVRVPLKLDRGVTGSSPVVSTLKRIIMAKIKDIKVNHGYAPMMGPNAIEEYRKLIDAIDDIRDLIAGHREDICTWKMR